MSSTALVKSDHLIIIFLQSSFSMTGIEAALVAVTIVLTTGGGFRRIGA